MPDREGETGDRPRGQARQGEGERTYRCERERGDGDRGRSRDEGTGRGYRFRGRSSRYGHEEREERDRGSFLTRPVRKLLRRPQARSFVWGAGAALAAVMLWPSIMRPLAVRAGAAVIHLADQTLEAVARAREDVQDVLAEAREVARAEQAGMPGNGVVHEGAEDLRAAVQTVQAEMREIRELLQRLTANRGEA